MSTTGRASLLDRVGSKVSGDGTELVSLEQDLRVLAKLRKDILSGKHPLYKPPPLSADVPTQPGDRQESREPAGLSLSERIAPSAPRVSSPAPDTKKEEQDFFNSIAQALPADLSESTTVQHSNEEGPAQDAKPDVKRARTSDLWDTPVEVAGTERVAEGPRDSTLHPPRGDARDADARPRSPLNAGSAALQRGPSSASQNRRERADSRSSNLSYGSKQARPDARNGPAGSGYRNEDGKPWVDKFANQRLPPGPVQDSLSSYPVNHKADDDRSRPATRTLPSAKVGKKKPLKNTAYRGQQPHYDREYVPRRSPTPPANGSSHDAQYRSRPLDARRAVSPAPAASYSSDYRGPTRPVDPSRRDELPYTASFNRSTDERYDDHYRGPPATRSRSRSPARTYPQDRSYIANSYPPSAGNRQRSASPSYKFQRRSPSPRARSYYDDRRASPPREGYPRRPSDAAAYDYRRDVARPLYGKEVPGHNDLDTRSNAAEDAGYPDDRYRMDVDPSYPAYGPRRTEVTAKEGTREPVPRRYTPPLDETRLRTSTYTKPQGEIVQGGIDARNVRDQRPAKALDDDRRSLDGRGAIGRDRPRPDVSLQDRMGGFSDARSGTANGAAQGNDQAARTWPPRNDAPRDADRSYPPETEPRSLRGSQDTRATQPYSAPYDGRTFDEKRYPREYGTDRAMHDSHYLNASRSLEDRLDDRTRRRGPSPPGLARDNRADRALTDAYDTGRYAREPPRPADDRYYSDKTAHDRASYGYPHSDDRSRPSDRPTRPRQPESPPPYPARGTPAAATAEYRTYAGSEGARKYDYPPAATSYRSAAEAPGYIPPSRNAYSSARGDYATARNSASGAAGYSREPRYQESGRPDVIRDSYDQRGERDAPKGYWPPAQADRPSDDRYRDGPGYARR